MKVLISIVQWMVFVAIVAGLLYLCSGLPQATPKWQMPGYEVLFFALALAFVWVEILRWGAVKPLNCVKCMTGWIALILAYAFGTQNWLLYLPAGLFVGAIYSAINMRWL